MNMVLKQAALLSSSQIIGNTAVCIFNESAGFWTISVARVLDTYVGMPAKFGRANMGLGGSIDPHTRRISINLVCRSGLNISNKYVVVISWVCLCHLAR